MNAITHPAYPSRRSLQVERRAEQIAAADIQAAQTLRAELLRAHAAIAALRFRTGWPIAGYDQEDALALILELAGEEADMRQEIEARALEIAEEDATAAAFDAAEMRREERSLSAFRSLYRDAPECAP